MGDDLRNEYCSDSEDEDNLNSEGEEDSSETPGLKLKGGTFLPDCCQQHSCGCCPATKKDCYASSKGNHDLARSALQLDLRTSVEVSAKFA